MALVTRLIKISAVLTTDQPIVSGLFLKCLALIYFSAFVSMVTQVEGLVGVDGILPIESLLRSVELRFPDNKYWLLPTIFWLDASDRTLVLVCYAGMLAALLVFVNYLTRTALVVCYLLYLSIYVAGQDFTGFQWDVLLLESGFLAILLTSGSGFVILLYRWLIVRFMFMGGLVKIASGDPTWANFTALNYHYQSQPLPQALSWYVHHFPEWLHKISVGGVFFIELLVPVMVFMPRPFRLFAGCSFMLLQLVIILTGNYTFFNLLTMALCLFLFDDQAVQAVLPKRCIKTLKRPQKGSSKWPYTITGFWLCLVLTVCATRIWVGLSKQQAFAPLSALIRLTSNLALVNSYGPFAVMTKVRREIIIQGSNDGLQWLNYQFKYKPDRLDKELAWVIPHQPRLDWQMWFQALSSLPKRGWFDSFMRQLQQGSPAVLGLLAYNPFPDRPPVYLRALIYRYRFTTPEQRAATGNIWQRDYPGVYWMDVPDFGKIP